MKKKNSKQILQPDKEGQKKCQAEKKDRQKRDDLPLRTQERHFP